MIPPMHMKNEGFTLIEVLVALIIIAIACFAVLHIVSSSINMNHRLEQHMVGSWISENVLADLRANALTIPADRQSLDGKTNMLYQSWPWHADLIDQDQSIGHYDQAVGISVKNPGINAATIWRLHGYIPLQDGANGQ